MGYAQFDDLYDDNPKVKRAWRIDPALVALHAMAITHCSRHNSDGEIHVDWVLEKLTLLRYTAKQRAVVVEQVEKLRLFERIDDEHYYVHDYLEWNRSRDQRLAMAEHGRRGGQAKAKPRPSKGLAEAQASAKLRAPATTTTTTTDTTTTAETSTPKVEPGRLDATEGRYLAMSLHFFEQLRARDPKAKGDPRGKRWVDAARLLHTEDGRSFEQIAAVMRWLPTDDFWPAVVLSMPKFREKFTQLVAKMDRPMLVDTASSNGHRIKESSPEGMAMRLGALVTQSNDSTIVDATCEEEA